MSPNLHLQHRTMSSLAVTQRKYHSSSLHQEHTYQIVGSHAIGPFCLCIYVESGGAQHEVGKIVNFVAPVGSGCDNCNQLREAGNTRTSSTYISPGLMGLCNKGVIPSFEIDVLEPYLAENLKWTLYGPGEHRTGVRATQGFQGNTCLYSL